MQEYLRELCEEGLKYRYGDKVSPAVRARLEHELGIICRMGFASYFLIVSDFVRFAVENKIPCSARGSACGALVSYVLKLSHVRRKAEGWRHVDTGCEEVWITHGAEDALVHWAIQRGLKAKPLHLMGYGDEEETEATLAP